MVDEKSKSKFLIRNLGKGLIWLSVLLVVFVLLKDNEYIHNLEWLISVSKERWLVFFIFLTSEVVFGLIPPEFFMIWSLHHGFSDSYILNVFYLAIISYFAGVVGYFIGMTFARTQIFKGLYQAYLVQYESIFKKFSGFILFVGAVTPLPFSAMCMLVGTIKYPKRKFFLISLTRFLRFIVYGYLMWQANEL